MIMEETPTVGVGLSGSLRDFRFDDETLLPCHDHHLVKGPPAGLGDQNRTWLHEDPETFGLAPSSRGTTEGEGDSVSDDNDFSETVFRYINRMLLEEEDVEDKSGVFLDPSALQAAEKSLYEVINEKTHRLSEQDVACPDLDSPEVVDSCYSGSSTSSGGELVDRSHCVAQIPVLQTFISDSSSVRPTVYIPSRPWNDMNRVKGSFERRSGSESMIQFQQGAEEARRLRFLPQNYQVFLDFAGNKHSLPLANGSKGKKNHERQNIESEEERSNKQLAVYIDETELSEMLDKILVCQGRGRRTDQGNGNTCYEKPGSVADAERNGHADVAKVEKARSKRTGSKKTEAVDLRALLTLCAQAVSTGDRRTAEDYVSQIRRNSTPSGNGSQRLAHYFVNALDARLSGSGSRICAELDARKMSAVDNLKAHHLYRSACPFQKLACIFANNNIMSLAEQATALHIIDFGIGYGLQWPSLIFRISKRAGGPPKLRITGIDLPERGFRPAGRVQATGQLLTKCCERFGVPFEYNGIAKKWETIRIEDLKLRKKETVAVNTLFRFKHLLDQTVAIDNPRDTVLNLIRRIKPDMFLQALVNGSFNAPFFVTRFREALFHYSSMFDAFDCNLSQEDRVRPMYEKEFFGKEAVNALACEGSDRVERPETNKQWQVRLLRAGFKQLPLDPLLMKKLRFKLKKQYHEDFVIDVDGQWMLQGWKGRILFASSGWVPA